jgi:hypothetical protein
MPVFWQNLAMAGSLPQARTENEKVELPRKLTDSLASRAQASQGVARAPSPAPQAARPVERGGPAGLEPTRYGDWERAGRCIDF